MAGPRLTRDLQHSMLGGVCAGFAARYDFDVTLVRVVAVLLTVASGGAAIAVYIAAWIVMPRFDSPAPQPRAAADTPDSLSRELREVTDRLSEAARVLADKSREAAEEISEIARRARNTEGAASTAASAGAAGASLTEQIDERAEQAESSPTATMTETPGLANGAETGGDVDESLSTSEPPRPPGSHWSPPHASGSPAPHPGMPPASSEQAPHQPPPPAGPLPPAP